MLSRFIHLFLPQQAVFIKKLLCFMPTTTIQYAMTYFYRTRGKFSIEYSNYDILVACLVIADKFTNDYCTKNIHYAASFQINLKFLNFIEGWIMRFMDYTFRVHSSELMVLQKMLCTSFSQSRLNPPKVYDQNEVITI